ncbi:MAG: hypothetical protein JSV64_06620 [Candidatus Bathyarchaeota archaeon]|nr:MAG: hypothetical protein JSV64_06620 [Candidatus Bathyarchaeota archaeon]
MIRDIPEFHKSAGIAGFRSTEIKDVIEVFSSIERELKSVTVQLFDAKLIAGWQHLFFAVLNGLQAFRNGTTISKSLAVECLLYACAQRQIKTAFELIGIKPGKPNIAALVLADSRDEVDNALNEVARFVSGIRDDAVLSLNKEKIAQVKSLFGISDVELGTKSGEKGEKAAILDLVIEHMALLITKR